MKASIDILRNRRVSLSSTTISSHGSLYSTSSSPLLVAHSFNKSTNRESLTVVNDIEVNIRSCVVPHSYYRIQHGRVLYLISVFCFREMRHGPGARRCVANLDKNLLQVLDWTKMQVLVKPAEPPWEQSYLQTK